MNNLFSQRLQSHFTQMSKYLKYVFNDFFVIALMFIIGGLGYQYSQFIKELTPQLWWEKPILIVVFLFSITLIKVTTFAKQADYIFWMPKEKAFYNFFKKGLIYSSIIAVLVQVMIWFITIPFFEKSANTTSLLDVIVLLITLIFLKVYVLNNQFLNNYHSSKKNYKTLYQVIVPLITLMIFMYLNTFVGLIIAVIMYVLSQLNLRKLKEQSINWKTVIANEESHENSLNRFFNMFTDVDNMQGIVKRRKALDGIFKWFNKDVYSLLYSRGLIRDKEISGLVFRLTILGGVLIALIDNQVVGIIVSLLFVYLIVFQLIPYFNNFNDNVFIAIYPIDGEQRIKSFINVIAKIMIIIVIIFFIASIISTNIIDSIELLVLLLIEYFVLIKIYVPNKIKKAQSNY